MVGVLARFVTQSYVLLLYVVSLRVPWHDRCAGSFGHLVGAYISASSSSVHTRASLSQVRWRGWGVGAVWSGLSHVRTLSRRLCRVELVSE
jgi:hypothetical protein